MYVGGTQVGRSGSASVEDLEMGERSLNFGPGFVPKTICDFLDELSTIADVPEKMLKLDEFVIRLEEEMKKIDSFKCELPLCTLLLNDAILALKESRQCVSIKAQPVLSPLMPVKKESDKSNESYGDKKNWMKSVHLWNSYGNIKYDTKAEHKKMEKETPLAAVDMSPSCRKGRGGKGFVPFKDSSVVPEKKGVKKKDEEEWPVQGLSLFPADIRDQSEKSSPNGLRSRGSRVALATSKDNESSSRGVSRHQQLGQKQRRCWSADLHRLFVSSLQQLGGAQVATPKQIRDLMQVEGLTNDEVKSHLQKYRLHTRRLHGTNQSLDVLGGLWPTQDEDGESSKVSSSHSSSPQGPLQLATTVKISIAGVESCEDDEDTKSESFGWKNHFHRPGKDVI